ncbi:hypothetical protein [Microbacterium atlanticum]|uniref:hypothetical protein n=1 Tax=Microbacterium atlanticum TaxID=2782168 RepID=UPI00188905C5|nr:hypothetical protein [Microbacterium atlanticum]
MSAAVHVVRRRRSPSQATSDQHKPFSIDIGLAILTSFGAGSQARSPRRLDSDSSADAVVCAGLRRAAACQ